VLVYTIGLALAVVLTATSFWVANTSLLWAAGVPLGLAVLAIAQMGVHLVFFLHITTGPDNTNNVLALAFGVLIVFLVVVGSLWIMADLNDNMMPPAELMNLHMQHWQRPQLPDTKAERREFVRRVIALDPVIRSGARGIQPRALPLADCKQPSTACSGRWMAGAELRHISVACPRPQGGRGPTSSCEAFRPSFDRYGGGLAGALDLLILWPTPRLRGGGADIACLPADTPSLRLLADETAKVLAGMLHVLDGLALLVDAPDHPSPGRAASG
jgi:cytochrome o ubiquinol oxidase operon protein cyoD